MNREEKQNILLFSKFGFRQFYADNHIFLENINYKPGKKTYRNLLSLNKFMKCYLHFNEDYIVKTEVIDYTGWDGSSSYVQHERIMTNFGLTDTSWQDRDRKVLLLSDDGKKLRNKYASFCKKYPTTDLAAMEELPDFAIKYLIEQLSATTSQNMTLWKNTIISGLFMYCTLGYIPHYSNAESEVSETENKAFRDCLNYVGNDGELQDITYTDQPIAMLKNLKLLNATGQLTNAGYNLLRNMKLFEETDISYDDYVDSFDDQISEVSAILSNETLMIQTDAPERKDRKSVIPTDPKTKRRPSNRNFAKEAERSDKIGKLGESLALSYERKRLSDLGVTNVEEKVFLTSENPEYGNAFPCDIISLDVTNNEVLYIEVKTTKSGKNTPFYISKEEVSFSDKNKEHYKLYRVYNVMNANSVPEFYITDGFVGDNFTLVGDRFIATRDIMKETDE